MIYKLHKYIIKKWIELRMAANEFSFKQPFQIKEEYPIMKSILFFALFPIELIFIFTYARIYGSLRAYTLMLIIITALINLIISTILINCIKESPFINETITFYEQLDYESRKKLYSFKNGLIVLFWMAFMPWFLCFICISIVCLIIPLWQLPIFSADL